MKKIKTNAFYIAILLPAMLLFLIFFIVPVVQSLSMSFTDAYGMKTTYDFVSLDNYIEAFQDSSFIQSIWITLEYMLITVIAGNILSLALALLMDTSIRFRSVLRSVFFIPNIMSLLIVGYVWSFVYTNFVPDVLKLLGLPTTAILGNIPIVVPAIALTGIWNTAGYYMIIYLAALQSVPLDSIEAARIDGASPLNVLFRIKLPLISPTVITCIILSAASHIKVFELPYTMTSGGPAGASMMMVLKIYNTAFNANRTGYATAQSTILFLIIGGITLVLTRLMKAREDKI